VETSYQKIECRWGDEWRVLRVRFASPPGNFLDREVIAELRQAIEEAAASSECALLVLEASGIHFSLGFHAQDRSPDRLEPLLREFHELLRVLVRTPLPLAAVVQGKCYGAGLELAAVCDFLFAEEKTRFLLPEIRLGHFPTAAPAILTHSLGAARMGSFLLSGLPMSGEEALGAGMVTQVFPPGKLQTGFESWLRGSLLECSSSALRIAIQAARIPWKEFFLRDLQKLETLYLRTTPKLPDAQEGVDAFLQERPPIWNHQAPA
jgi:cyclohexa-1,5-dienecarbonyl-CoA hydratase